MSVGYRRQSSAAGLDLRAELLVDVLARRHPDAAVECHPRRKRDRDTDDAAGQAEHRSLDGDEADERPGRDPCRRQCCQLLALLADEKGQDVQHEHHRRHHGQ